ncbi:MAG: hypothetical protein ABMA64_37355, partial [Myxococcota bacterium]
PPEPADAPADAPSVPSPPPTHATFRATGDAARVFLVSPSGATFSPGDAVPPGTYFIHAAFGDRAYDGEDRLAVAAGDAVVVRCNVGLTRCRWEAP